MRYTKDQLRQALEGATNWTTVNVRLGRIPDARSQPLRDLAKQYGLSTDGIVNPTARSYSDEELAEAIKGARSWGEAAERLGKSRRAGASIQVMRRAAERLELDISHLDRRPRK